MRVFTCTCGNSLFFDNTLCTNCGRTVGWCETCDAITALEPAGEPEWTCGGCSGTVRLCHNYAEEQVCNRSVPADSGDEYCSACMLTETIPDLDIDGNRERWARLEGAKRRLIYSLDRLALPYGLDTDPPLRFAFKGDGEMSGLWRTAGDEERVLTGHADGLVTINIREADDAEREALRVDMGEAHRTLIGHFRHEIGHYYWDLLVRGRHEDEFIELFGDHENPTYSDALERHYSEGAPPGWEGNHVSSYATMHPWEDWAETFAHWLDIVSVLDTARGVGLSATAVPDDPEAMTLRFARLGLVMNELSREMGLLDFAPIAGTAVITKKLSFIHRVMRAAERGPAPAFT